MSYYKDYDENDIYKEYEDEISAEDLDEFLKMLVQYKYEQEKTLVVDLRKYKKAYRIYQQLTYLMNEYDAEYTISIDEYDPLAPTSITYIIITDIFRTTNSKIKLLREIINNIDAIDVIPRLDEKLGVFITIKDIYIDTDEVTE